MHERRRFLRGMVDWVGFKQVPIDYWRAGRMTGRGASYPALFRLAFEAIVSFSDVPLKLATYFGTLIALASGIGALAILVLTAAGAVGIAAAIGIPIGLVAGFFGGWRDAVLMRAVDVLLALPGILFAMAMIAVIGRSQAAALIAVGVTGIPSFARVTRAQVLSLRKRDFVTAVEAFGGTRRRTTRLRRWQG